MLFLPLGDEALEAFGAQGLGEGVALQHVGPKAGDDAGVLVGFDALGDDADTERVADIDDGRNELALALESTTGITS